VHLPLVGFAHNEKAQWDWKDIFGVTIMKRSVCKMVVETVRALRQVA